MSRSARARDVAIGCAALVVVCVSVWSGARARPHDVAPRARARKVVLFGFSGVGWDDLEHGPVPNLHSLVARGAVGAMTVRTVSALPSLAEGYASLGAGARLRSPSPETQFATAGSTSGGQWRVLGVPRLVAANKARYLPTGPGALGEALGRAGRRAAVVGNADAKAPSRPEALAVMDAAGSVGSGWVEPSTVLESNSSAPSGVQASAAKMAAAVNAALARADVVVVEPGDLERAATSPPSASLDSARRQQALAATDRALGAVEETMSPETLLLVVSVVPPANTWHLTPVVVAGPGVPHGYVDSPSTKRLGLVTLTDVAPEVIAALGSPVPPALIGHAFRYQIGSVSLTRLAGLDADGRARADTYPSIAWSLVALHGLVYGAAAWVLWRRRPRRGVAALRYGVLAIAAFPLASYLLRLVPPAHWHGLSPLGLLVVDVGLVAMATRAKSHALAPLGVLAGMTVGLLIVDVASGARLQVNSLLGYAPLSADRFFGIGGTTLGVLVATTLVAAAVYVQRATDRRRAVPVVAALFFVVVVIAGSPTLGAKVGGILTMVPVFVLTLAAFAGRRPTWRMVAVAIALTVAALTAAALVELLRPPAARAHLGQLVGTTGASGGHSLLTTIARKAATDVRVFLETVWSWVALIIVVFLGYLLLWDHRFARILPPGSAVRIGALGALGAGVLGLVLNDTGIIITALVLLYLGPYITLLALDAAAQVAPGGGGEAVRAGVGMVSLPEPRGADSAPVEDGNIPVP